MKLDLPLHLRLALDDAWAAFNNAATLAEAIPGATVAESDPASARGSLTVDLGWASVAYRGAIRIEESDVIARSVTLRGIGQGEAGEGLGELSAIVKLRDEGGGTVADVALDVTVEGDVGELLSDDPETLARRIGEQVAASLAGEPAPDSGSGPPDSGSVTTTTTAAAPAGVSDLDARADDDPSADSSSAEPAVNIAPDIPEPVRMSPMDEVAMASANTRQDTEDPGESADPGEGSGSEYEIVMDAPGEDLADEAIAAPDEAEEAEPLPPVTRLDVAQPQSEPAEPVDPMASPAVAAAPPADAVVPEIPKAARTGSIPPPGWTPPTSGGSGGIGGGGAAKPARRLPGRKPKAKPAAAPGAATPTKAPGAGGLADLVAKVRSALKR